MPTVNPSVQRALQNALQKQCGFAVTNVRDCQTLLEDITLAAPHHRLGLSTIRRFFGLVPHEGGFSSTSLNIFARHCGHLSFQDFDTAHGAAHPSTTLTLEERAGQILLNAFENIRSGDGSPLQIRAMVKAGIRIQQNAEQAEHVWREAHKTEVTRKAYTELAPPFDWMASYGREQMEDYVARSSTEEERIFGQGLLAFGEAFMGNWTSSRQRLDLLPTGYNPDTHPLPQGRLIGLRLLDDVLRDNENGILDNIDALSDGLSHQENRGDTPFFQRVCVPFIALALGQRPRRAVQSPLLSLISRCAEGLSNWLNSQDPFIPSLEGIEPYRQMLLMANALIQPAEPIKLETRSRGFHHGFASDRLIQSAQFHSVIVGIHPPQSRDAVRAQDIINWAVNQMKYPELGRLLHDYAQRIRERK